MDSQLPNINSFLPHVRKQGIITIEINNTPISFDLAFSHERAYALKYIMNTRYPQHDIDILLFEHFIEKDDVVLDAGANIGVTALEALNKQAARVIAIEPVAQLYARLKSLVNNSITPVKSAIFSQDRDNSVLYKSISHNQGSTINKEVLNIFPDIFTENIQTEPTKFLTIDSITKTHGVTDVWKLDVEGAEVSAIRGAKKTLENTPPRVIIAEVYDPFLSDFIAAVKTSHPIMHRAFIEKKNYVLSLQPMDTKMDNDKYWYTSPMYVFTQKCL